MTTRCGCLASTLALLFLVVASSSPAPVSAAKTPLYSATNVRAGLTRSSNFWGHQNRQHDLGLVPARLIKDLRGGSSVEEEEEDEDAYDDEEYDSEEEEEDEEEEEETEAEEEEDEDGSADGVQIEVKVEKFYDEPLAPSPMTNLYASLGVMLLGRRVDLFSKNVVRLARIAYISYLILHQLFLLYVRFQAKSINDRTPIELKNPLSSVLQSQLGDKEGGDNGMMKNLASSFLSSKSTVMEYDLKQARSMQSGLIFSMCFMWFLHFKMNQVQPLLIQSITGMSTLIYSPLFQIYGMGRNLERPFKNPAMKRAEEAAKQSAEAAAAEKETDDEEEEVEETEEAVAAEAEEEDKETTEESDDESEAEAEAEGDTADEEEKEADDEAEAEQDEETEESSAEDDEEDAVDEDADDDKEDAEEDDEQDEDEVVEES